MSRHPRDSRDDRLDSMRRSNLEQREFYESRFRANSREDGHRAEEAANWITNLWTSLRRKAYASADKIGISGRFLDLHIEWVETVDPDRILDLGCFSGNELSLWMAERASLYVGIDLSKSAIASLREKLSQKGVTNARALAVDFLEADLEADSFDLVYAKSVLHHFEYLDPVLEKLRYVLSPGGVVITHDPLKTEPLNRGIRALYRPFQSDDEWEWPFTRATISTLQRHFILERTQGFMGAPRYAFPLLLIPFASSVARRLGEKAYELDRVMASQPGPYLFNMCWQVSLLMRRANNRG